MLLMNRDDTHSFGDAEQVEAQAVIYMKQLQHIFLN